MIPKQLYLPNHLNPLMPVYICIRNSIQGLTNKKITKTTKSDIFEIINAHGTQAQKFMFTCLIQSIDIKEMKQKAQSSGKVNFLNQSLTDLSTRENFMYYFADVLVNSVKNPIEYAQNLIKYLKLPIMTQIIIALSLYLSENPSVSKQGYNFLKNKLNEYYQLGKPVIFPNKILQELLFQIGKNPQLQSDLEDTYQYLLDTNVPDKTNEVKFYHFLNKNNKVYSYEPPLVTKPAEIIKKADILRDLGPYCTFNAESLKIALQQFGPLTEEDVFECLMVMAEENIIVEDSLDRFMTDLMVANKKINKAEEWKKFYSGIDLAEKKMQAGWNVDIFLTYAVQNVSNLKWISVLGYFDRLNLNFSTPQVFVNMFKFFQKAKKQGPKYRTPEILFFKRWNHPRSQLNFLINLFKCDQPDLLCLNEINNKKVSRSADALKNSNTLQYQMWSYPDLVQLLVELSDYDYMSTRQLFEIPLTNCPQLLLQTLSEINFTKGDAILNQLFSQLFPVYIGNHANHIKLIENIWEANEDLVISSICEIYKNESKKENSCLNLSKVLDITQNIRQGLIPLSSWNDYSFSVALGILAGKREFLHFEQWIKERLKNVGGAFLVAILQYVEDNFLKQIRDYIAKYGAKSQSIHQSIDIQLEKAQLSRELLAFVYESSLQFPCNQFSVRAVEMLKKQYKEICQHFPQMTDSQVIDQIQLKAQKNFFRIYKEEISLQQAIQMMHNLRNSVKQEEKELYASMITYLFTELRFHSNYPEKELMITAYFFAGIINAKFIEKKLFTVFLQVLNDDLKYNDRRYNFSTTVIDKIKDRLIEEPIFVEGLLDNEQIVAKNPEIVKDLLDMFNPPLDISPEKLAMLKSSMDTKFAPPPAPEPEKVVVPEKEVDVTQTDGDILEIDEKIQKSAKNNPNIGKLNLFCNTLTKESLKDKLSDLSKLLDSKDISKWFSYHLVYKRITSCQVTMLAVYMDLINEMPTISKSVISLTYKVLQKWFGLQGKSINDKKLKSFKNIGLWLGKLTLGRSEPILITKLNLKDILIKSYSEKTRLTMNLEVVSKILESRTHDHFIFSLKNPWISPIFGVLKELIGKTNDGNIKVEIQRLFKNILVQENEILETNFLSFSMDKSTLTIAQLPEYVQICEEELKVYIDKGVDLRKIIAQAVDAAIQEIVPPVISRSVTIALVTTKQLALKDFILEPDDQKLLKGTHYIAQNLSGSLALVTCREPLKMSLNTFLRKKLEEYAFLAESDNELIIAAATRDNLDLGCALIKRAVIQKALEEIDKDAMIQQQLEKRREAKANGQPFHNDSSYYLEVAEYIPEPLRPRIGGLNKDELKIYEDFQKDKRSSSSQDKKDDSLLSKEKLQKLMMLVEDGESPENIKESMLKSDFSGHAEFGQKLILILFQHKDKFTKYFLELFKLVRNHSRPEQNYAFFLQNMTRNRKQYESMIGELCSIGYFPPEAIKASTKKVTSVEVYEDKELEQKAKTLLKGAIRSSKDIEEYFNGLAERFANGSEEDVRKFFYFSILYAVKRCLKSKQSISEVLDFKYIDEVSKLILTGLRTVSNNKNIYLGCVFDSLIMVIQLYHDTDQPLFNQRPFFKLILNIIQDLSANSFTLDENVILTSFAALSTLLHKLEPMAFPGFSFAWLELISNKFFMPTILERYEYWDLYHELLLDSLRFAKNKLTLEALANNQMFKVYYKGILRLVTILLHDFPDFSSEFSFTLSNQIPDRFIQLRNVILSAFPQTQWFPEPQTIQSKDLETIKYMKELPKYYKTQYTKDIAVLGILKSDDKLLALKSSLEKQSSKNINQFILNAGLAVANEAYPEDSKQMEQNQKQVQQLIIWLLTKSDTPIQEKFIRGILNLIRFPNLLTLFFIRLTSKILYQETNPSLQQSFIKAIFERMVVEKPHPWGIIFVVNEIKRNKKKLAHLEMKQLNEL